MIDPELTDFIDGVSSTCRRYLDKYLAERDRKTAGRVLQIFQKLHGNPPEFEKFQAAVVNEFNTP